MKRVHFEKNKLAAYANSTYYINTQNISTARSDAFFFTPCLCVCYGDTAILPRFTRLQNCSLFGITWFIYKPRKAVENKHFFGKFIILKSNGKAH